MMNNKKYNLLMILTAVLMVFAMMPMMSQTVYADSEVTKDGVRYSLHDDNTATVIGYTDDLPANVVFPETVDGHTVTGIGNEAFDRYKGTLSSITIPKTVTAIGSYAFFDAGLTSVSIDEDSELTYIGIGAFERLGGLETITIPQKVKVIGPGAFKTSGLKTVVFEENSELTEVQPTAFMECGNLTSITIPNSVTSIGYSAFEACSSLTSITIPKSVTSIEKDAFANSGLASVTFETGTSLEVIGYNAFGSCSNLKTITIPASVTSLGEQAFVYNDNLQSVTFEPESRMTTIGDSAFASSGLAVIHYIGDETAWDNIAKGNNWKPDSCSVHCVPNKTTRKATPDANGCIERYMCDEEDCADWGYGGTVISKPAEFILSETSYTFDGTEKKPKVSVKDAGGNIISESNYDVVYSNNTNAGTATAKVTFKGDKYEGSKNLTFKITAKKTTPTMTLSAASYTYDGKVKTPAVTVKAGSTTLKNDTDYTVSYASGRKNAGSYKVTVTLKGNYSGSASKTFTINKAANPLAVQGVTAAVKLSDLKQKNQKLAVKEVIKTTKKGQGTVTYALSSAKKGSKSFKKYFKVNKTTGMVTVKKGLKKGKYKVKINVTASGNGNYKKATKPVTVTIKVK